MSQNKTKPALRNYIMGKAPNAAEDSTARHPLGVPLPKILETIKDNADHAPLINHMGALIATPPPEDIDGVPRTEHLSHITKPRQLDGWAREAYQVTWTGKEVITGVLTDKSRPVSWGAVLERLPHALPYHEGVELLPHYPPRTRTHYIKDASHYTKGDGTALDKLVSMFNPDTDADRHLLKALLLTPMWGGIPGTIPLFVLTTDHGRGVGKSKTADVVERIYGGSTRVDVGSSSNAANALKRALGTPGEESKRVVIMDNVKGRQNSAAFEAMITAPYLPVDRLFHGGWQPPNNKTWVMTLNSPSLSTDLADRAVVIKIGPKQHGVDFVSQSREFIDEHREELIADILREMKAAPSCQISPENRDRWMGWQDAILTRFDNGNDLAALIKSRRADVDTEADEAADLVMHIKEVLTVRGIDPETTNVCIPGKDVLVEPMKAFWDLRSLGLRGKKGLWARLKTFYPSEPFREYAIKKGKPTSRTYRGLVWQPDPDGAVLDWSEAIEQGDTTAQGKVIGLPTRKPKKAFDSNPQGQSWEDSPNVVDDDELQPLMDAIHGEDDPKPKKSSPPRRVHVCDQCGERCFPGGCENCTDAGVVLRQLED